jgi:cytochrome d ubiquinol oxidase subunit I
MSALELARLQFATTASIHFLFVLVTLGLVTLLVYLQSAWFVTGKPVYERLTRFWGTIYLINYVLGIAAGIVMEFQFGLNWSRLSSFVGNVFGAPIALETLLAFFLESTLLGMWIFGWHRLRRGLHLALLYGVALTAYLSAFFIMIANAWLQHPVGYEQRHGTAYLTDFGALLRNPSFGMALGHVLSAGLMTGGTVMAGISAWLLIRRAPDYALLRTSLRVGLVTMSVAGVPLLGFGFAQFAVVAGLQPAKFGDEAQKQAAAAGWTARFGPGDYLPPQWIGAPLGFMILIGFVLAWAFVFLPLLHRDWIIRLRFPLFLIGLAMPLPFAAAVFGWTFREVGRQPWAAYGVLPTADAVSPVSATTLLTSYLGLTALLLALLAADWALIAKRAARGTADPALGRRLDDLPDETRPEPALAR